MNYKNLHVSYNSFLEEYKKPFGAVKVEDEVRFRLHVQGRRNIKATLVIAKEGETEQYRQMWPEDGGFYTAVSASGEPGLYFYYFIINYDEANQHHTFYIGAKSHGLGGHGTIYGQKWDVVPYQITLHAYDTPAPQWYKDGIFYQIFVDRFCNGNEDGRVLNPKPNSFLYSSWSDTPMYIKDCDGNIMRWDFFGGNFLGVIKKLDYLKDMGITGLYLNPVFKARSNHKYDTGDYMTIDEMFGDEETFQRLIQEAKARGIQIVLDGVFNHVGADSIYFNAFQTYDSLGAFESMDSPYYKWFNFHDYPSNYECWWGVKDLPNVNEEDAQYRAFINGKGGVIDKWTSMGIGGWRLDVADEMPDEFIEDIRTAMDNAGKDKVLIGEVWEDASNKIAYGKRRKYLLGKELHATMNYPFKDSVLAYLKGHLKAWDLYVRFMSLKENYPKEAFHSAFNNLGTHDTRRVYTELEDKEKLRIAVGMLMTFPGVPCVYYGDEAGMKGESDPHNRGPYPWGREDEEIRAIYTEMIQLRQSSPVFRGGEFLPFYQGNVFGYLRCEKDEGYLVLVNPDDGETRIVLDDAEGLREIPERFAHILSGEFYLGAKSFGSYEIRCN